MNTGEQKQSIKERVFEKIRSGHAIMRPKWHFVLKATLAIVGTIILALALLYLTSFILFMLRETGVWFTPAFGFRGVGVFLASLPWLLVLATTVFVVVLEILVARYSFAYRKPLLYSLIGIIVIVTAGTFVVSRIGFHEGIMRYAEERELPFAGPFYREYGRGRLEFVHPGIITETTENGFRMESPRREIIDITISPDTRFPLGMNIQEGDCVIVLGKRADDTIEADGVRRIEEGMRCFPPRPGGPQPMMMPFPVMQ